MNYRTPLSLAAVLATTLGALPLAHATNGMLLEGYGPVAAGMGGASTATDNGIAAVTQSNPSTVKLRLKELVEKGCFLPKGQTHGAHYVRGSRS